MIGNRDRIAGCLLGLAAGDRIGGPAQMAIVLAESLVACGGLNLVDLGARYLQWWLGGGFDTGPTAEGVFRLVEKGRSYREAAEIIHQEQNELTAGCNPLHRCPPLALCSAIPDGNLNQAAREEARLTHFHPLAGEGAALVVSLIRRLIRGLSWQGSLMESARGQPDWIKNMIFTKRPPHSQGGFTPEVLQAALYFLNTSQEFREPLQRSLEFAGPANYCPVLVGSLGGARWGASQVNPSLIQIDPNRRDALISFAEGFSQDRGS